MPEEERTREMRRAFYLATAIHLASDEVEQIVGLLDRERHDQLLGVLHRHLESAWNDGAVREVDLRTAVSIERDSKRKLQKEIEQLRRQLHEALKRISDGR